MSISLLSALLMGAMGWQMLRRARFARTRRMALLPLSAAAVELMTAGLLSAGRFPLMTLLLAALRVTILLACAGALRQDASAHRRKGRPVREPRRAARTAHAAAPAAPGRCA